jgi:hypothetical protein
MKDLDTQTDGTKQFFYYPLTNELFSDYSEYVNRVILYKQQIWTCKYTGKNCLTYEEALRCERKYLSRVIHNKYPRYLLKAICQMVHRMDIDIGNAKFIVDEIFDKYVSQFLEGEEVMCRFEGYPDLIPVRVLSLEDIRGHYKVRIIHPEEDELDEQLNVLENGSNIHIIHSDNLFRLGEHITRVGLTNWLSEWTLQNMQTRKLELRPELVEYYFLNDDSNSRENVERIKKNTGAIAETTARVPVYSRIRATNSVSYSNASPVSSASPFEIRSSLRTERKIVERSKQHADDKFPVCIPFDESVNREDLPTQDNLFIVLPQELLAHALEIWNFCFAFREYIECSPFAFYDFQQALLFRHDEKAGEEPSPLLHSVLSSLLSFLLTRDKVSTNRHEIQRAIQRMKKRFNELIEAEDNKSIEKFADVNSRRASENNEAVLRLCDNSKFLSCIVLKEYWSMFLQNRAAQEPEKYDFDEAEFFDLDAKRRLIVLHTLVEQCLQLQITRDFLKTKIMNARKQKLTAFVTEEFNTSELVPARIMSLGKDRFDNRYWFFPGFTGCIFVESIIAKDSEVLSDGLQTPKVSNQTQYGIICTEKQLTNLQNWLDPSETVERRLKAKLLKNENDIRRAMEHMKVMLSQGDSEIIKQDLFRRRKELEAKAAELNAELEEEEDNESEDEEEQSDSEEQEENTDSIENNEIEEPARRKRVRKDSKAFDKNNENNNSKTKRNITSSTWTRRRRGSSMKKEAQKNVDSTKESLVSSSERRSERLVKKRKAESNSISYKQEQPAKKRPKASKENGSSASYTSKAKSQKNAVEQKTAAPIQAGKSNGSSSLNSQGASSNIKKIQKKVNGLPFFFPKFLSINSHRYYINEYDFAYLQLMEEEKEEKEEKEEGNNEGKEEEKEEGKEEKELENSNTSSQMKREKLEEI